MRGIVIAAAMTVFVWAGPARACNPDPPVPPILEGHDYDATARDYLIEQAQTVAVGRYRGRLDFLLQGEGGGPDRPDYLFDLREGWKEPLPSRLVIPGHWVSCNLSLQPGASFLIYLDGSTPLFILPAEDAFEDLKTLGELDWFYTTSGQLILPELVEGVGEGAVGAEEDR